MFRRLMPRSGLMAAVTSSETASLLIPSHGCNGATVRWGSTTSTKFSSRTTKNSTNKPPSLKRKKPATLTHARVGSKSVKASPIRKGARTPSPATKLTKKQSPKKSAPTAARTSSRSRQQTEVVSRTKGATSTSFSPVATEVPLSTEEILATFVQRYDRLVPKTDVSGRIRLAQLEGRDYLHVADPMDDGYYEAEAEQITAILERGGVELSPESINLLQSMLEDAEQEQEQDLSTLDSQLVTEGEHDDDDEGPMFRSSVTSDKIVLETDQLLADGADAEFAPVMEKVRIFHQQAEAASDALERQQPRLFMNFTQRAAYHMAGLPRQATSSSSSAAEVQPTENESVSPLVESATVNLPLEDEADLDPLGIAAMRLNFYDDRYGPLHDKQSTLRDVVELEPSGFFASEAPPPSDLEKTSKAVTAAARSKKKGSGAGSLDLSSTTPASAVSEEQQRVLQRGMQKVVDTTEVQLREEKSKLHLRTGVTLVAIGTQLGADAENLSTLGLTEAPKTRVVILEGDRARMMQARANDLYAHLLVSTMGEDDIIHEGSATGGWC